jgi:hypothetical protein
LYSALIAGATGGGCGCPSLDLACGSFGFLRGEDAVGSLVSRERVVPEVDLLSLRRIDFYSSRVLVVEGVTRD